QITLDKMANCVSQLQQKKWLGHSQKPITDIVHIGIGGSHLGMVMASQALQDYSITTLRCHFVSSLDATQLYEILATLNPETTLSILASKTFTTAETLRNAERAKAWLINHQCPQDKLKQHFIATTANEASAKAYGIAEEAIFPLWDWVGGRYSLWSSVGLPL